MAKDTASTRIPRLDGASRIPLPGSLRPPSTSAQAVSGLASRTTQIFQRASTVGFPQKRPSTLVGLRPSIVNTHALKRSASGDHITNAISLVGKKTTTALKKWMGKPEKMLPPPVAPKTQSVAQLNKNKRKPTPANKAAAPASVVAASDYLSTPRPQLTRSDTFVRTDSPNDNDIINFTPNLLTQSTPAPPTCGALTTTRIIRPPDINETTKLLSNNTRHVLYTTQSLDISLLQPAAEFGETFEASMKRTMTLDETKGDITISLNNQYSPNATQTTLKPNLTTTYNAPAHFCQTMNVVASSETFTAKPQETSNDTVHLESTCSLGGTKIVDSADAISPITNATYSNPDSLDNLQFLEDVSAPSGFLEMDLTLHSESASEHEKTRENLLDYSGCSETDEMDSTLKPLAPEKTHMKLPLNSTVNTDCLLNLTSNMLSPSNRQMHMMNLTKDYLDATASHNTSQLLYMTQNAYAGSERNMLDLGDSRKYQDRTHLLPSPQAGLKGAHSDLVLPTRTPDDEPLSVPMDVDAGALLAVGARTEEFFMSCNGKRGQTVGNATSLQDVNDPNAKQKSRYSFGLDLTESTLDCSIDLVDVSLSSNAAGQPTGNNSMTAHPQSPSKQTHLQQQHQQLQPLRRQTSFELDESLGILTPDQMKEFLDSTNTNNTNNLELPLVHTTNKMAMHHMRIDQTPSPEELPLDPVEVKTDVTELLLSQQQHQQSDLFDSTLTLQHQQQLQQQQQQQLQQQQLQTSSISTVETVSTHTDTDISSKTSDAMTKSNVSKISTSFITSVTSVTSLDTGYQGDGEMSRPASRGACDHSPSNGPTTRKGGHVSRQPSFNQQQQQLPLVRRQDPMTDSDFFTESDADDIFHRGDRRAQVIDGQLYGPMLQQPAASVFISEDPEDSCMESSGIFTDVENRCDDDLAQMRRQDTQDAMLDMSPEGDGDDSTETVKSNRGTGKNLLSSERLANKSGINACGDITVTTTSRNVAAATTLGQGQMSNSQTSSTIHSSMSTDRLSASTLSNRTSYCSVDGNTVNADCKSFSSLEEAFDESTSALNLNETINHTTLSPASAECTRRSRLSTTGNDNGGSANSRSGDECSAGVEIQQRASVQRVTPPRKHASLTSLSTVTANNAVFNGAKIGLESGENKYAAFGLTATRGRALIERETHSETGTAGTQAAGASTSSSTTSLSLGNHNKTIHHSTLEAAVAAAAAKAANATGNANKRTQRSTASSTKFASARNSPKLKQQQHAYTGSVASIGGDITVNVRKKQTPNKWDAVMNKIQSNKALPKKNLKEVKSKVSTILRPSNGVVGATIRGGGGAVTAIISNGVDSTRARLSGSGGLQGRSSATSTPLIRRSPTSNTMSPRTFGSPTTTAQQVSKRLFQGVAAKRGRSYSKDSQKSSQSDLSMASAGGGSPKLLAKTPLRAAKKRDVRNLSISPTDLGPPPKAQQTAKGTSTRLKPATISLTQKRYPSQSVAGTPSTPSTAVTTPTGSGGGNSKLKSPPTIKKSVKDQNRAGGGSVATKNAKHPTDIPTELHEINHNNNNSITTTTAATAAAATAISNGTTTTARTNSQTPSPILGHHGKKSTTTASAVVGVTGAVSGVAGGTLLEKKSQSKFLPTRGKALLQKSHQQQRSAEDTAPVPATSAAERLDATELQRLKYLNRHSCNGRLDYEAIERHLQQTELQEEQRNKSIEVLGVLLQYAVHDLDAFACPRIKAEKAKIQNYLNTTLKLLDEAKTSCTHLQDQLCDKEGYYTQREEDLQALHRCEMEKAQAALADYQAFAQQKILALESQLDAQTLTHKRTLDSYRLEMDNKLTQKQQQLDAAEERERSLKERFSALEISEQELRDKLTSTENAYAARLQAATEREHTLNERVKALSRELDTLRASKEHRERELRDKLHLSQDEISVLRSSQRSFNESLDRSSGFSSPRNSSTSELSRLQSEADSLHCVLELKQKEISKLTKHNEELMRDAEERAVLQGKISLLESSNEMLKSELEIKSEKEKDFLRQINDMQKAYNHEATKRKRLSYDNEQLQWQLKQRSEQLHIVETKLHELSAVESINASNQSSLGSLHRSQLLNGSSLINFQMEDISPPTSPVVKGVIEKPDSVSWVLEMDDETPEAAASKMVKRAGSFRSVERSPSARRQLSGCSSAINTSLNSVGSANGHNSTLSGPNPLSQSMSATSVIRQHSSDGRHEFPNSRAHSRIRSKSVSVKSSEPPQAGNGGALNTGSVGTKSGKRLLRQSSSSNARKQHQLELINWKEPISSSSPHPMRARTSTMCSEVAPATEKHDDTLFQRTPTSSTGARKLITCDTSKLNSGERLDMQSLPTHASVHDLKKKFHEIQESAGEAMVSGTNSEDEGCSASSDEIVCSVSTSSATTGSTSSLKNSLEEVLLLEKINSLNGTPMEVSWSDDPEIFTNGSTV